MPVSSDSRKMRILEILAEFPNRDITLDEMREKLRERNISTTQRQIGKDLDDLQKIGFMLIKRPHGKVRALSIWGNTLHSNRLELNLVAKRKIGRAVADRLIEYVRETGNDLTVAFGSGTTTPKVAEFILERAEEFLGHFHFITNNIEIILELTARNKAGVVMGGNIFREQAVFTGPIAAAVFEMRRQPLDRIGDMNGTSFIPNTSIMGVSGISSGNSGGFFASDPRLLPHKRAMISTATKEVILVGDHNKIGNKGGVCVFTFSDMERDKRENPGKEYILFTDDQAIKDEKCKEELDRLAEHGLKVKIARSTSQVDLCNLDSG